jgi:hypothetical protein
MKEIREAERKRRRQMNRRMKGLRQRVRLLLAGMVCALTLGIPVWTANVRAIAENTSAPEASVVYAVVSQNGFSPSSITEEAGQITLKVGNRTGQAGLAMQLYDGQGNLLKEGAFPQGSVEWSETFNLAAGSYRLVAGHNPDRVCQITVQ